MRFTDRGEAGRRLAEKLLHLKDRQPIVLALPRGGVAIGFEISRVLNAPLDIVLVRKSVCPGSPSCRRHRFASRRFLSTGAQ
jgi:putative phosphoribosyl transferase